MRTGQGAVENVVSDSFGGLFDRIIGSVLGGGDSSPTQYSTF